MEGPEVWVFMHLHQHLPVCRHPQHFSDQEPFNTSGMMLGAWSVAPFC